MEKEIRKVKLVYSIELLVFAVVFITLGILELLAVIKIKPAFQLIFKIVTLIGATWFIIDFIWVLKSPKRRPKNCLLDKVMLLPLSAYLYVFDIYGFVAQPDVGYYQVGIPLAFMYIACAYIFQAIYHYYKPIPAVLEMIEEIKNPPKEEIPEEEKPVEQIEQPVEEQNDEEKEA